MNTAPGMAQSNAVPGNVPYLIFAFFGGIIRKNEKGELNMELFEAINTRRSVRVYADRPVPREVIDHPTQERTIQFLSRFS